MSDIDDINRAYSSNKVPWPYAGKRVEEVEQAVPAQEEERTEKKQEEK